MGSYPFYFAATLLTAGSLPINHGDMTTTADLVARAERYAQRAGLTLSTVSGKILNDGSRLKDLKAGGSRMFPETLAAAMARLKVLEAELKRISA